MFDSIKALNLSKIKILEIYKTKHIGFIFFAVDKLFIIL